MGQGLTPLATSVAQQAMTQPAPSSQPAPPQPVQVAQPMSQTPTSQGKGMPSSNDIKNLMPTPPDPAQTQGQTPQFGQPNQYAQTVGMGNNTSSQSPTPSGAGKGKGG